MKLRSSVHVGRAMEQCFERTVMVVKELGAYVEVRWRSVTKGP